MKKSLDEELNIKLEKKLEEQREPTKEEWEKLELELKYSFKEEFKNFIGLMGKYDFPGEVLGVGEESENDTIYLVYSSEIGEGCWEEDKIPFYSVGNGDYYCFSKEDAGKSNIYYVNHETLSAEKEYEEFRDWVDDILDN